jgi:hypothetical protein
MRMTAWIHGGTASTDLGGEAQADAPAVDREVG